MKPDMNPKNLTPEQKKQMEELKKTASKYKGKSEKELMNELRHIQNKDGGSSMSPEKMRKFKQKVSPMLNNQQKSKLDQLLRELENNKKLR